MGRRIKSLAAVAALVVMIGAGCVYKGAKITEGTDLAVGLNVPSTSGTLQLHLFNYLSGFRLGLAEHSRLDLVYTVAETNTFLGVISTKTAKRIEATVAPLEKIDNGDTKKDGESPTVEP